MSVVLRYYQNDLIDAIQAKWLAGVQSVLAVLATGGGKTVIVGDIVRRHKGAACISAHRQELVSQISLALARYGVRHKIIAPDKVVRGIVRLHVEEVGASFVNPASLVAVASVDTLIRSGPLVDERWLQEVTLLIHDEGHHVLTANKWGRATDQFTNPRLKVLSVSATPERADGRGLGRKAEGIVDTMVEGPTTRPLINEGYLTEYRIVLAESDIKLSQDMISRETGEFIQSKLKAAVRGSHVVGDVVAAYKKYTPGQRALVFASDVETSIDMAASFRAAGVRAMHVDADTPDDVRDDAKRKLKRGDLDVLTNVGLFGEGYDLPVVAAVYDTAATESFAAYAQRFGRMLRLSIPPELMAVWDRYTPDERKAHIAASGKPHGFYVDLVGNLLRHKGPPDRPRVWSLESRERRGSNSDAELTTTCRNIDVDGSGYACGKDYERYLAKCPYCGYKPEPSARSGPEFVAGDWRELDAETLARMRGEIIDVSAPYVHTQGLPLAYAKHNANAHQARIDAQLNLRDAFAWWAGEQRARGLDDGEIYRLFYLTFGIDTLSAWALKKPEADILSNRIDSLLTVASLQSRVSNN
jgi:DNA repair protein RadD